MGRGIPVAIVALVNIVQKLPYFIAHETIILKKYINNKHSNHIPIEPINF